MKIIFVTLILLVSSLTTFSEPCYDYACDSMAVKAILNSNGLDSIPVDSVGLADSTGRI